MIGKDRVAEESRNATDRKGLAHNKAEAADRLL